VPTWKIFPALARGQHDRLQAVRGDAQTASISAKLLEQVGLPAGVLNVVHGNGTNVGWPMVQHPGVDVISFTGSNAVGARIHAEGARLGKRVSLEMGGKNGVIVLDDADVELAAQAIAWGAFGTTGQRCTATSRVIVHERVHDELVKAVVKRAQALKVGNGLSDGVEMGPLVNAKQLERVSGYMKVAAEEGAKVATGGVRASGGELDRGFYFQPTVLTDLTPGMRVAQEEIFGPVVGFLKVKSLEEAIAVNNDTPFGLSSSIFTANVNAGVHRDARSHDRHRVREPRHDLAPRRTCRSAARAGPATVTARPATPCSTLSPSGRACTWTSVARSSGRRSTTTRGRHEPSRVSGQGALRSLRSAGCCRARSPARPRRRVTSRPRSAARSSSRRRCRRVGVARPVV
jgi:acyl-CoA reductase-like NAD-dependent aldehyde dehydrogenase